MEAPVRTLLLDKRSQLDELCRRYRVKTLELFGSATGETWDADTSDLDFLVEFLQLDAGQPFSYYFGLREGLETLFERPINLVSTRAITNAYFRQSVDRTRQVVYAA
jgi:predicted nucleotidyltransferase